MIIAPIRGVTLFLATALVAGAALGAALTANTIVTHARAADADGALVVRVLAPPGPEAVTTAARLMRQLPGVTRAAPMDAARAADLLGAWGGAPVDPATLPALRLIEARRSAGRASDTEISAVLRAGGIRAELHSADTGAGDSAQTAGIATCAGVAAVTVLALVLLLLHAADARARGAAAGLLADLGATRGGVVGAYGRDAAGFAFAAGGAAALVTAFVAAGVLIALGEPLSLDMMLARVSSSEAALVLLAPLATAALATIGARAGAARAFDRADQLG